MASLGHIAIGMAAGRAYAGSGYDLLTTELAFHAAPAVMRPSETCILSEGLTARTADGDAMLAFGCDGRGAHQDGQNLLFLDGHAKFVTGNPERQPGFRDSSGCWEATYFSFDR